MASLDGGRSRRISLESTVVARPDQVSCDLAGDAVILNLHSGVYYGLNEVGAQVWELIKSPVRVAAICERLVADYDVERARCEQDLLAVLLEMQDAGLVEVRDDPVAPTA